MTVRVAILILLLAIVGCGGKRTPAPEVSETDKPDAITSGEVVEISRGG